MGMGRTEGQKDKENGTVFPIMINWSTVARQKAERNQNLILGQR